MCPYGWLPHLPDFNVYGALLLVGGGDAFWFFIPKNALDARLYLC